MCQKPWNKVDEESEDVTFCEHCKQWFHNSCIGVVTDAVDKVEKFVCMPCSMFLLQEVSILSNKIKQLTENAAKTESVDKTGKTVIKKNEQQIEKFKTEIEEAEETHKKQLDLRQKSLESITSQSKSLKKENGQLMLKADKLEKKVLELEDENRRLTNENSAHLEFVRTSLGTDDIIKEFENLKEEKAQLSETLNKKELIIKDLEEETASDAFKQKMAALKKQNDSLKERITAFETTVNDLQDELKKSKHNLQVATANYNREVELNNILMKKTSPLSQTQPQSAGMSPQQNVEHQIDIAEDENVPEASPTANRSKENRSTNIARAKVPVA